MTTTPIPRANSRDEAEAAVETAARWVYDSFLNLDWFQHKALLSNAGLTIGDCSVWLRHDNTIVAWADDGTIEEPGQDHWFGIDLDTGEEAPV